jgi:hypothetical protein
MMKLATFLTIFGISAATSSSMLYAKMIRSDCGLSEAQARMIVVEDLHLNGLRERFLGNARSAGDCRYDFSYDDDTAGGQEDGRTMLEYSVVRDWSQGLSLVKRDASPPQ